MTVKERTAMLRKQRYNSDNNYRIRTKSRMMLRQAIECNYYTKILEYVGLSMNELRLYLQLTACRNGYKDFDIDNMTSNFQIDHIIPVSKYDLTNEDDMYFCYNYRNLQILSKEDNIKKGTT